ncbi:MAG TPA: hypothetical protein ENI23_16320 [bacterium]|nr:hypothetical protein [bacterium]
MKVHIGLYNKNDEDDEDDKDCKRVDSLDGEGKSFIETIKNAIENYEADNKPIKPTTKGHNDS